MSMPRQLLRLIYASRSTEASSAALDETVRTVLIKSISNNRMADVTGLLLIHSRWFVQVLEGPEKSVRETFERISGDTRHDNITLLGESRVDNRQFRDWNMCERRIGLAEAGLLTSLGQSEQFAPDRLSEDEAVRLLTSVGRSHAA